MPELGFESEIVEAGNKIKKYVKEDKPLFVAEEKIKDILLKEGDEMLGRYVGKGGECVVLDAKGGSDGEGERVVALTYRDKDPREMKLIFYGQRLMSTLFPNNFPHFHAAFGKHPETDDERNLSGTIREKVKSKAISYTEANKAKAAGEHPFTEVEGLVERLDLPVRFDVSTFNYGENEDGSAVYWDKVKIIGFFEKEMKEGVVEYMKDKGYSKRDIRVVEMCMARSNDLFFSRWR